MRCLLRINELIKVVAVEVHLSQAALGSPPDRIRLDLAFARRRGFIARSDSRTDYTPGIRGRLPQSAGTTEPGTPLWLWLFPEYLLNSTPLADFIIPARFCPAPGHHFVVGNRQGFVLSDGSNWAECVQVAYT